MKAKEHVLRKIEKSIANTHGAFSLGLFSTVLWEYSVTPNSKWAWIGLLVVAVIFAFSSFYFLMVHKWNRQKMADIFSSVGLDYVGWFLGFAALGVGLIQTRLNWAAIPGLVCIYGGYLIIFTGVIRAFTSLRKKDIN